MSKLPRRNMGRTGMQPRALGMGAAFVGASGEAETIATIERALDLGIDYFDSYAGRNEDRWGKALAGVERSSYYMQAKVGPHPERPKDFSAEATRWSVEQSLQSIRVDYLDAVLVHDPPDIADPLGPGRAFDELQKMKEEGLVRHIGLGGPRSRLPPRYHRGWPRRDRPHLPRLYAARPIRRPHHHALGQKARYGPDLGQRLRHGSLDGH